MLTEKDLKNMELQVPTYEFVEESKDAPKVSPIKRTIAKIQETATTFSLYEVYASIAQLDRVIKEGEEKTQRDKDTRALFMAELDLIEKELGVKEAEEQFKNEQLAEAAIAEMKKKAEEKGS